MSTSLVEPRRTFPALSLAASAPPRCPRAPLPPARSLDVPPHSLTLPSPASALSEPDFLSPPLLLAKFYFLKTQLKHLYLYPHLHPLCASHKPWPSKLSLLLCWSVFLTTMSSLRAGTVSFLSLGPQRFHKVTHREWTSDC